MLIGSASRYITGRGAVQRVYWRVKKTNDAPAGKFVKYGKTLNFQKGETRPECYANDSISQHNNGLRQS